MEKYEIAIQNFIQDRGYLENDHVLGAFFYGSYLTGLQHKRSDIDLHIVFDNTNPLHLIRGNKYYGDMKMNILKNQLEICIYLFKMM